MTTEVDVGDPITVLFFYEEFIEHAIVSEVTGLHIGTAHKGRDQSWVRKSSEGRIWVRGHHAYDSEEVRAAMAAMALLI
jgi:hypothetical protein